MILPQAGLGGDSRRRLLREAKALAQLQHPNIVQIHEVGEQESRPFLALEYVAGESLASSLAARPWPPRRAAELLAVLARAVDAAHRHGIVHRDLKPHNILLTPDGTPKICDFGLARCLDADLAVTQTGTVAGTPGYMAPEQARGGPAAQGPAVDIHALGVILYEALTGRPPFLADNPWDILQLVANREPVAPRQYQPKTPHDLETICLKCLAKEPQRRYATALELAHDLERFLANVPIRARPSSVPERSWRWCRRHPSAAALLAVAAAAVSAILALVLGYNARLARALARTEAAWQQVARAQTSLLQTLTGEIAQRLDGDLRELAAVPVAAAALMEQGFGGDRVQLERAVTAMLTRSPRIFGLCVAGEPGAIEADCRDFALYVFRGREGLTLKQLVPPAYQPHYRQWPWYRAARNQRAGAWSEPYVGPGAEGMPMVTFSAPLERDARFAGVVTADLAMDYFRELRASMDRLALGSGGFCFVVTANHTIVAHPDDRYEFPSPKARLTSLPLHSTFRRLMDLWTASASGTARAVDFATGKPATFHFARVPATGWTVVTASD